MSKAGVEQVLTRFAEDREWAQQVARDPKSLDQFDLTPEERAALINQDVGKVEAMGVDERLTKRTGIGAAKDTSSR